MGHQIIKQPDGKLAVFSSGVDDWIWKDAGAKELEDWYAELAAQEARDSARETIYYVLNDEPEKVYYQFAMTYEEAEELRKSNHGEVDE